MKVLFLLVALFIVTQADETSWNSFQVKHNKIYANKMESQLRQKIFSDNLRTIEEHNKKYEQGLVSYKLGINQFADLTNEEFAARFKTFKADEKILQGGQEKPDLTNNGTNKVPNEVDWRTKSVVSEVKDQGSCGGCWTFSATGTLESQLAIQTGELKLISEQQLLDCDVAKNHGCVGGVVQWAYDYVKDHGLTLEENYPYKAVQSSCKSSRNKPAVVWTQGYVNIDQNNETDLKQAVGLVGPVSVAINADPIQLYQEGIFNGVCSDDINHAVLAVGYGRDNKTGMEYWIIKNSWGPEWGEKGYFKLRKGTNLCGVALQSCYPILGSSGFSLEGGIFSFLILVIYLFLY